MKLNGTAGDQIVLRHVWQGIVRAAVPVTVVQDTPELIATYLRVGTRYMRRVGPLWCPKDWHLLDKIWDSHNVLSLVTPGAAHSVYAMWGEGHSPFKWWYINLQEPYRRTSIGFDTMDQVLDIVVSADQSEWRWKDEEAFLEAQAMGVFTSERAGETRAECERVLESMRANKPPFRSAWEQWSPSPEWPTPELPEGWDAAL